MPGKKTLIAAINLLILFTVKMSAQDNSHEPVQKTSKSKLLKPKDFKHSDVGNPATAGAVNLPGGVFDLTENSYV